MEKEQEIPPGQFEPFDIEVEQTVLASILRKDQRLPIVASVVEPADFYDPMHARIFEKMLVLEELERPITARTLHAVMKNDPGLVTLKAMGNWPEGENYLGVLVDFAPAASDGELKDLARTLAALRSRRDALDALADAQDRLAQGSKIETALGPVVKVADRVALAEVHRVTTPGLEDAFERLNRELDSSGTKDRGLMTGWPKLDKILGGFQPESFTVIAGRPGMGKSILGTNLLTIAGQARDEADRPIFLPTTFSLEMSQGENVARIIAELDFRQCLKLGRTDPIHYSNVRKNRLTDEQFTRYVLLGQTLRDLGVEVYDQARMTMQKIRALARARAALHPEAKVVTVIDHIQIVKGGDRYRGNRIEELTEITGLCKELAKSLGSPVIGLSQLSRGVESREDKRPVLSDLRDSGSIEQDADAVLFLYRPEYYLRAALRHAQNSAGKGELAAKLLIQVEQSKGKLDIDVAKNRHGSVGDAHLWIDVASGVIMNDPPGDDGPQAELGFGGSGEPLDGLSDLEKRTGAK